MDPSTTVKLFLAAVIAGDLDVAAQAERDYRTWILRGGFPAQIETAVDGEAAVSCLDNEQDRIGVCISAHDAGLGLVEKWISVMACFELDLQVLS